MNFVSRRADSTFVVLLHLLIWGNMGSEYLNLFYFFIALDV